MFSHQSSKESKLYLKRETVFSPALQATSRPPQNGIHILCQRETVNKQSFQSTSPPIYNNKLCSQELILQFIFNTRFILISGIEFFPEIILNLHFLTKRHIYRNNFFSPWDFCTLFEWCIIKPKKKVGWGLLRGFWVQGIFFFFLIGKKRKADGFGI